MDSSTLVSLHTSNGVLLPLLVPNNIRLAIVTDKDPQRGEFRSRATPSMKLNSASKRAGIKRPSVSSLTSSKHTAKAPKLDNNAKRGRQPSNTQRLLQEIKKNYKLSDELMQQGFVTENQYVHRRVYREFVTPTGTVGAWGTIVAYLSDTKNGGIQLWRVLHDDADEEELDWTDLQATLKATELHKDDDPSAIEGNIFLTGKELVGFLSPGRCVHYRAQNGRKCIWCRGSATCRHEQITINCAICRKHAATSS